MSLGTIVIRADASVEIGTGHVMRCLALAQAWQDAGGRAAFAIAEPTAAIQARLAIEGFKCVVVPAPPGTPEDAAYTVALSRVENADWVVLDGYVFDAGYQQDIRSAGLKLLFIDDAAMSEFYAANIVLNQNSNAQADMYRARCANTRLLLGTEFALLRREFAKWIAFGRRIPRHAGTVLVSLGGSDPTGLTAKIREIGRFAGLETTLLWGGSSRATSDCEVSGTTQLHNHSDMASVMAGSDISIVAGGVTLWESLFMGCATLSYSRNPLQETIIRKLHDDGVLRWLGNVESFDSRALAAVVAEVACSAEQRRVMAEAGKRIVDGRGAQRVLFALQQWT